MIIDRLLRNAAMYSRFWTVFGGRCPEIHVRTYVRPSLGDRILDLGCGTADVLGHLPTGVHYVGIDADERYIAHARARFGHRAEFRHLPLDQVLAAGLGAFEIVLATGVIHHVDDRTAAELFGVARTAITPRGRLVTIDPCFVAGQSAAARFLLHRDRGKFVRRAVDYERLARAAFPVVDVFIRHDLVPLPYTHLVMECRPEGVRPPPVTAVAHRSTTSPRPA
jgi:SAM-dependent methyltransferase